MITDNGVINYSNLHKEGINIIFKEYENRFIYFITKLAQRKLQRNDYSDVLEPIDEFESRLLAIAYLDNSQMYIRYDWNIYWLDHDNNLYKWFVENKFLMILDTEWELDLDHLQFILKMKKESFQYMDEYIISFYQICSIIYILYSICEKYMNGIRGISD